MTDAADGGGDGGVAVLTAGATWARTVPPRETAIPVLVLGAYHMGNPGQDLHNARIARVTTPAKQAELAALADQLARFRPTVIAVEAGSTAPDYADARYARFTPADLTRDPDETVQIGYRLARLTGARVIAVDVQERDGEPSYFPFEPVATWAKAHPAAQATLDRANAEVAAWTRALEADQARKTVTQILAEMNDPGPAGQVAMHRRFYQALLTFGQGDAQPGAELNARWYARNAKIFGKIAQATRPGDRVLVVYGAGHLYWLSHLAAETPGYRLEPAARYLR